jgi:excinuclease UvrABC ATPase subunit
VRYSRQYFAVGSAAASTDQNEKEEEERKREEKKRMLHAAKGRRRLEEEKKKKGLTFEQENLISEPFEAIAGHLEGNLVGRMDRCHTCDGVGIVESGIDNVIGSSKAALNIGNKVGTSDRHDGLFRSPALLWGKVRDNDNGCIGAK